MALSIAVSVNGIRSLDTLTNYSRSKAALQFTFDAIGYQTNQVLDDVRTRITTQILDPYRARGPSALHKFGHDFATLDVSYYALNLQLCVTGAKFARPDSFSTKRS